LLVGVVAGADQGAGFDVAETHLEGFGFEVGELARGVEAGHGQVIARGAQILADGEYVAVDGGEVAEDLKQLGCFFAEADHDSGFCYACGVQLLGITEQLEGALVACAGADDAIEARDGLGVVVEHFRAGFDDDADGFGVASEVGDEDFDAAAGGLAADLVDHHGEGARAADQIVVAIDAGDDGVLQAEGGYGFSDAARLVEVDGLGATLGDGAEAAAARAEIAEHHEGCGFMVPALADVGAVGAFAHGVEIERARQALEVVVILAHGGAGLEPVGLGRGDPGGGRDLD